MDEKHKEALLRQWYDSLKSSNPEKLKGRTFEEFRESPIVQVGLKTFLEWAYEESGFQKLFGRSAEEILILIQEDQARRPMG